MRGQECVTEKECGYKNDARMPKVRDIYDPCRRLQIQVDRPIGAEDCERRRYSFHLM